MKRQLFWFLIMMLPAAEFLTADSRQHLFETANAAYTQGEFQTALDTYREILGMGYESGPLYYNMGNCHYKLGHTGPAILFYERAARLMPSDEDLKANLAIARLAAVDQIEPGADFILVQAVHAFFHLMPRPLQLTVTLSAYGLFMAAVIFFLLTRAPMGRYAARRLMWITGVLFFVLALSLAGRLIDERNTIEAVILADKVDVMSAPTTQGGVDAFSLHEGTKVRLDRSNGDWVEIILPDRKVGWVKRDVLEVI